MKDGKDRQAEYQARLKESGAIRFTVFVDGEAAGILEREKNRTGETNAQVISRALKAIDSNRTAQQIDELKKLFTGVYDKLSEYVSTNKEIAADIPLKAVSADVSTVITNISTDTPERLQTGQRDGLGDNISTISTDKGTDRKPEGANVSTQKGKKTPEEIQAITRRAHILKQSGLSFVAIEKQLRSEGYQVGKSTLQRYLSGQMIGLHEAVK